MRIKDFAAAIGVSEHTLRYYEKAGVLKPVKRSPSGYREFDDSDLGWMEFVLKLKGTGMSIEKIGEYARLRDLGPGTASQRLALLEDHEKQVAANLDAQQICLKKIREKILYYRSLEVLP